MADHTDGTAGASFGNWGTHMGRKECTSECTVTNVLLRIISSTGEALSPPKKLGGLAKHYVPDMPPPSMDSPIAIENESWSLVNVQKEYNTTGTEALLEVVKTADNTHTLSLGGQSTSCNDTWFKEYSCVQRGPSGIPSGVVFFWYESQKFPGHFVRWYRDNTVNCEPKTTNPTSIEYKWLKDPVTNNNSWTFDRLKAPVNGPNSPLGELYLTFKDNQPLIEEDYNIAGKFLISPIRF